MHSRQIVVKDVTDLSPQFTSHGIGEKLVLLANDDTSSAITQIAMTKLHEGDTVEPHAHATMDEHFFFLEGEGFININDRMIVIKPGRFILVPALYNHYLRAVTEMNFITIGVAIK